MAEQLDRLTAALADWYAIERELGTGGMATVYLAEDVKHHRKVAVKVLRPELAALLGAERFLNEIEVTANLQHPHILPLFDSGEADSFVFYVMPYVEGESLREKLQREKQLTVEDAIGITEQVAAALEYAHGHEIIHRDIKPENVLLEAGQAVVADFGIALAVTAAGGTRLTETGLSLGTPQYMSPEQATADRVLDARSDVYSLACVLYEMLVGETPHTGPTVQAIMAKVLSDAPTPITRARAFVPSNVDAAVQKALAKSPADRFASAKQFAEALTNPAFSLPTTQPVAVAGAEAMRLWKRLSLTLAGLVVLMTVVALWLWLIPEPPSPIVRYSMAFPEGEQSGPTNQTRFALSPDGERFVYVGIGNQERRQLWMRRRDELHATPLPGTDGAVNPFFSPDGVRVGFRTPRPRVVKWVPLSGGPPTTVLDSALGVGATWGPDDRIYAATTGGLARVGANGGVAEPLTTIDSASGERAHRWPEVLPNGKGVLFTVWRGVESDVAVLDLATGTRRVLVGGIVGKYASSGHLLYVTASGTLMAAPFDQDALTLTGGATALIGGLRTGLAGAVDLTMSAQGTLMYTTGGGYSGLPTRLSPTELMWVTRDGSVESIDSGWTGDFRFPALSPDGTRLAVAIGEGGGRQLWIRELDRGPLSKLTFGPASHSRPAWTPEGAVAFVSDSAGHRDLYVRAADGSAPATLLRDEEESIQNVAFSHDGKWLLYTVGQANTGDIYGARIGVDSAPVPLVVGDLHEGEPDLSPDGRWLAYVAGSTLIGYNVYVRPFPNTSDAVWPVSTSSGDGPVWAHNGRELFYARTGGDIMSVEIVPGPTFIMGERRVLFSAPGFLIHGYKGYDVTPDDQRFVMIRNLGSSEADQLIVVENFFEELKAKVGNE